MIFVEEKWLFAIILLMIQPSSFGIKIEKVLRMEQQKFQPTVAATWKFGAIAVEKAIPILSQGGNALDALEQGVNAVELDTADQYYVGVGGYPNQDGIMELDAAIMDHELRYGAVMGLTDIARPISVARTIMQDCQHNILTGKGALEWALEHGFSKENILTKSIEKEFYEWKLSQLTATVATAATATTDSSVSKSVPTSAIKTNLPATVHAEESWKRENEDTQQHDTVGMICLDQYGHLAAGTSTSGWRYKLPGRVGDSPVIGSGIYCDGSVAAAVATGDGEEIMRTCVSFLIVESIRNGMSVQDACVAGVGRIQALIPKKPTLSTMHSKLVVGVIAMDKHGNVGAASTMSEVNIQRGHPHFLVPTWKADVTGIQILEAGLQGVSFP